MTDSPAPDKEASTGKPSRQALPASWRIGRTGYGLLAIARILGVLFALLAAAPYAFEAVGLWGLVPLSVFVGAFAHKVTYIMHDCSHFNLFAKRRTNILVGTAAGAVLGSSFQTFTKVHWAHHAALASGRDPQAEDYVGLEQTRPAGLIWHLVKPVLGFSLYKMFLFNRQAASPDREKPASGGRFDALSILVYTGLAQLLIAALATDFGRIWWMIFFYPVSAATFGLMFSRIRSFCEHIAPWAADKPDFVRTHLPNIMDGLLVFDLNFNFHREHHSYPAIASCYLPQVHSMKRAELHDEASISNSLLQTIVHRTRAAARPATNRYINDPT